MKIAYFVKKRLSADPKIIEVVGQFASRGAEVYKLADSVEEGTDMILCFGGDGTFLSASALGLLFDVPLLGVNIGRMGFLSDNSVDNVAESVLSGNYSVEQRVMLQAGLSGISIPGFFPYALNEVAITRTGPGTIGIDVNIDGEALPTYWADGLLVATSSGSTAYNLSVGGPICLPSADVIVVSPIAPHNLGVRPLVIPSSSKVTLGVKARNSQVCLSLDNRSVVVGEGVTVDLQAAPKKLKRVVLGKSNFIDALRTRFFWGQDVRNTTE